jgi:hypothetical protein
MAWWKRAGVECMGSALFRGGLPPRAENYETLAKTGFAVTRGPDAANAHWSLELRHPQWGHGTLVCLRDAPMPPKVLIDFETRLTSAQRDDARAAGSSLSVVRPAQSDDVLRERKHFLRFLRAALGEHGAVAVDHVSQAFWSRDALDVETSHDADVDIDALFTVHAVMPERGEDPYWVHTHGLRELGFTDFDILAPDPAVTGHGYDLVRALAFAIVEERARPGGGAFDLAEPDGLVRLVAAERLLARGAGTAEWRAEVDDEHRRGHAVACDPSRKWFGLFEGAPRPSRFLSGPIPDEILISFSHSASDLMAVRARATYPLLCRLAGELKGLPLPIAAKLGYVVDGGGPDDREHLWFEVHECRADRIDATLQNQPFRIARMRQGDRGPHDPSLLSDWMILTPFGQVNPRAMTALRELRERRGELEKMLRDA